MLLNASIVFNELKKLHKAEMSGKCSSELDLARPEFYLDGESTFLSNHLYVASVEHLPQRPQFGKGSTLVVIGSSPILNSYRNKTCLIIIKDRADFFKVYQEVQDIFNTYEAWERSLFMNLFNGADIATIVSDAAPLFGKPVLLLDRSFKLVASHGVAEDMLGQFQGNASSLSLSSISEFLNDANPIIDEHKPTIINLIDQAVLCTNLFNDADEYEGCLCLYSADKSFRDGDEALSEVFAQALQVAIKNNASVINSAKPPLKLLLQSLLDEMPLSPSQRLVLDAHNGKTSFVCVYLRTMKGSDQLPSTYICNTFEQSFEDSHAFVHDDSVVCFVNLDRLRDKKSGDYLARLTATLSEFLTHMRLCAGISNEFSNLFDIRIHAFQAESAIENGRLISPDDQLFFFSTYALVEMIINSLGGKPAQTYYPKGLVEMMQHDEHAGVSYLETLSVFLEENMSYSAAASRLFIHRSTLVDRIARITRESGIDLKDPNQRLQLEMLLKAAEIERLFQQ